MVRYSRYRRRDRQTLTKLFKFPAGKILPRKSDCELSIARRVMAQFISKPRILRTSAVAVAAQSEYTFDLNLADVLPNADAVAISRLPDGKLQKQIAGR